MEKVTNIELAAKKVLAINVPEGESRYTTYGVSFTTAINNFKKFCPEAEQYVKQNNDKLECLVDWGNGPEWIQGDVITQLRGVDNYLYMFTPVDINVIESPEWAVKDAKTGEMYKPAAKNIYAVSFEQDHNYTNDFGYKNKDQHYGTYVFMYNNEPRVMDLESIKMGRVEGSPLVGKILIEGAIHHELYAITAKVFNKKNAELAENK